MNLKNHLLIAMPNLEDPNFSKSVTLICEHDEQGAIGLVLNRPLPLHVGELLQQLNIECVQNKWAHKPVMSGGPVNPENGFVLHRPAGTYQNTLLVNDDIALSSSLDVLQALAQNKGPNEAIVALGYAGWAAGQLEHELKSNAWLTHPADNDMLFYTHFDKLWDAAAKAIGIDINQISNYAGHA